MSNKKFTKEQKLEQIKDGFLQRLEASFSNGIRYEDMEEDINQFLNDLQDDNLEKKIKIMINKRSKNKINILYKKKK